MVDPVSAPAQARLLSRHQITMALIVNVNAAMLGVSASFPAASMIAAATIHPAARIALVKLFMLAPS
jgi:hypothetical protein